MKNLLIGAFSRVVATLRNGGVDAKVTAVRTPEPHVLITTCSTNAERVYELFPTMSVTVNRSVRIPGRRAKSTTLTTEMPVKISVPFPCSCHPEDRSHDALARNIALINRLRDQ